MVLLRKILKKTAVRVGLIVIVVGSLTAVVLVQTTSGGLSASQKRQVASAVAQWWQDQQSRKAAQATPPPTAPTTVAPTTTTVPPPCPKSPEEASKLGGSASDWSVLPETDDGQGWKYGADGNAPYVDLTHPGYGRLDIDGGQISSGTVNVNVATFWCMATGGEPAETLTGQTASAPEPAASPRARVYDPEPEPAPDPEPEPAPDCPAFGGAATSPQSDGGCLFDGSETVRIVPSDWVARFRDASTIACSGIPILTSRATLYPASKLDCNYSSLDLSSPPAAPPTTPTTSDPTPPPSGGCPSFAGIATSPLNDNTGGCKLALQPTNVSGTVASGWKLVYWNGSRNIEAAAGTSVEVQEGTLYPV